MLQKKEYQQQQRYQATPTKTNVTKEGIPTTTTTIKKSIVENQTSGKTKIKCYKRRNTNNNNNKNKPTTNNKDTSNTDKN